MRVHCETSDFEHLAREVLAGRLEFAVADTTGAERHPTRLAIEPVAEHRMFFFVRQGHPLVAAKEHSLETILVFPLVSPRLPQRMAVHLGKDAAHARVDRETGETFIGEVPEYSVLVPGSLPGKPLKNGQPGPNTACAVIVKRVDERTRSKTSINELLRD